MVSTGACCDTYPKPKGHISVPIGKPALVPSACTIYFAVFFASVVFTPLSSGREADSSIVGIPTSGAALHIATTPGTAIHLVLLGAFGLHSGSTATGCRPFQHCFLLHSLSIALCLCFCFGSSLLSSQNLESLFFKLLHSGLVIAFCQQSHCWGQ